MRLNFGGLCTYPVLLRFRGSKWFNFFFVPILRSITFIRYFMIKLPNWDQEFLSSDWEKLGFLQALVTSTCSLTHHENVHRLKQKRCKSRWSQFAALLQFRPLSEKKLHFFPNSLFSLDSIMIINYLDKNYNIFQTTRFNHTMIFFKLID